MTTFRSLLLAALLLTLAGCASSGPATSSAPSTSADTTATAKTPSDSAASDAASSSSEPSSESPSQSSSRRSSRTSSSESAPEPEESAELEEPAAPSAPDDWYHQDAADAQFPGLGTNKAYATVLAGQPAKDTVTVAVIDSGVDIDHEDLQGKIWVNNDEIPGNGVDDDDNGYVDDVHGWNFIGGEDGEDVEYDTYEVTRLYAKLNERFAGVDSAAVAPAEREAYQRYQRIRSDFQTQRRETKQQLSNVQSANDAVRFAQQLLQQQLGTDSLTQEAVANISSPRQQVQRARDILMYFYNQGLSPSDVQEYHDHLKDKLEYNLNPDFNPRPIVGDDYDDKQERRYGNNDVVGPEADHGTHVAGIVAAARDNGMGINGVARAVRIMSVRTVPNGDERDKDVANAIRYAVDNGADVINMSFGKSYSPYKQVVDEAVAYADSMDVLMVHAAGNDGEDVDSTANYPTRQFTTGGAAERWIEVGASSWQGGRQLAAPFSNFGDETVDVFAPGASIYSTVPNNRYERNDGTSMAAPMVTGLAALLMSYHPDLSASEVRSLILDTATRYADQQVTSPATGNIVPFRSLSRTGAVVNAYAALRQAAQMTP